MAALPQPPVITILFYAPGTGFGTTVPRVPFTIAHATFGDAERVKAMNGNRRFDIETAFTHRHVNLKDRRVIPGHIQLTGAWGVSDPTKQMVFDTTDGSSAGHTYQRLIDFMSTAKKRNLGKKNNFLPIYEIYTVVDAPDSSENLNFLFNAMRDAGYPDTFFDVCITASKGIRSLIPMIEKWKMDTNLVLINGGAVGYLRDRLSRGSKVKAVVLTHGANDTQMVNENFIRDFINGNDTKVFIYSNKKDGHNQASLILGETQTLHPSLQKQTNRDFVYSYLPILVNSAYYVGRKGESWGYLSVLLKKDPRFVNNTDSLMVGGMRTMTGGRYTDKCGCDKNHTNIMHGGIGINSGSGTDVNPDNLDNYLYPVTDDEPFSDLVDSPIVIEQDIEEFTQRGGYQGYPMVGHRMSEIIYNRNKTDYQYLDSII